ncbi:hypothetical protein U9M48_002772 [Paspalum notatum var. saurae]|uniref:Reverse transcriptase zinc-binding domain-containing protein n=1 Tax=Paspalum notatum var. saurae TaxID=547442 RepID=A0AAQ3PK20_PASNO
MNKDGVWQQLLRRKYLKNKTIGEVKDRFLNLSIFSLHNGTQCRFWKDGWLGNFSLKDQFSSILLERNMIQLRALVGDNLINWNELVAKNAFVIFNATYWACFWSLLQKVNNSPFMKWACWALETMS